MPKHYVTFGQIHTHRVNGITLDCDSVACYEARNALTGRAEAHKYFGNNFFNDYHDTAFKIQDLQYVPKKIVQIDKLIK